MFHRIKLPSYFEMLFLSFIRTSCLTAEKSQITGGGFIPLTREIQERLVGRLNVLPLQSPAEENLRMFGTILTGIISRGFYQQRNGSHPKPSFPIPRVLTRTVLRVLRRTLERSMRLGLIQNPPKELYPGPFFVPGFIQNSTEVLNGTL